uniref:Uncharacterized protein n=1 Tax=Lepeophtheirus salmonis TaxID=72036 RepID=A0A0K2TPX5_LEPSM
MQTRASNLKTLKASVDEHWNSMISIA